jgi:hypothetical protein
MKTLTSTQPHFPALPEMREVRVRAQRTDDARPSPEPRPTRISRATEDEALFAYNRQAQTQAHRPSPAIDVYV